MVFSEALVAKTPHREQTISLDGTDGAFLELAENQDIGLDGVNFEREIDNHNSYYKRQQTLSDQS